MSSGAEAAKGRGTLVKGMAAEAGVLAKHPLVAPANSPATVIMKP